MRTLVIASGNAGKVEEFQGLLKHLPLYVVAQPEGIEVEESGTTFAANARLKAVAVAAATGAWALADDSGLSVDALEGAPGVFSARYAPTDPERIAKLLAAMDGRKNRKAQFRAALCIAAPDGSVLLEVEGFCQGQITQEPRGEGGFGYDPLLIVDGGDRTLAEFSPEEKNAVSHRGNAFRALAEDLRELLAG